MFERPEKLSLLHMFYIANTLAQCQAVADVRGASNYVRLHIGGRVHLVRDTLTAIAAKLPPERFVRVHRSAIVNVDAIRRLEPSGHGEYRITLTDGAILTSSRGQSPALRALLT